MKRWPNTCCNKLGNWGLAQQKYMLWCCGYCCGDVNGKGNAYRNICKHGSNLTLLPWQRWSKSNQSTATPNSDYTLLRNFSKIEIGWQLPYFCNDMQK